MGNPVCDEGSADLLCFCAVEEDSFGPMSVATYQDH